jgi:thiol-disulfide isomerase/thioredoxin
MATWCTACKEELPQFRRLRAAFNPQELAIAGVPIDQTETARQIGEWGAAHKPAYGLLTGLSGAQVASVKSVVLERLNLDAVPAAIVTDRDGNVLLARWGPPTLSQLRELLARVRGDARANGTLRRCVTPGDSRDSSASPPR